MARLVVDRAREKEDAGFEDEAVAEGLDVFGGLEAGKADGAGVGRSPFEDVRMSGEESGELAEVAKDDLKIPVDKFLAMTEGESGEEFAGSAGADGV